MYIETLDTLILFTVTTPIVGLASPRRVRRRILNIYAVIGVLLSAYFLLRLYGKVKAGGAVLIGRYPLGAYLMIDMFSVFMAFVFLTLGLLAMVYSWDYIEEENPTLFYTLFLGLLIGLVGIVFAGDFFTLFIFWELMCLISYTMVAFRKERWEALEASFKYLIMSAAGGATILLAISFLYATAGTLNFIYLASFFRDSKPNLFLILTLILFIVGFGINAGVVPLHTWLPDAHPAAPTPISAMLSGVIIKASIYALCRILFFVFFTGFFPGEMILIASLSIITMTAGNIMALLQDDIKRLLAYSSIAHIGYILVGVSIGTQMALTGTILHILNHALMKGAAFLSAGAIIYRLKTRSLRNMAGVGRRMPVTVAAFAVSLFALTGMPPLNGFISELVLFTSSVQADMAWLGIAIIINSILSAAYVLRILRSLLRADGDGRWRNVKEAPLTMLLPICLMATLIILFGIWPDPVLDLAKRAADALLYGYLGGG